MYRSCVPLKRDAEMPEALISTGLDGVYPYMDICRCEQMGRAHRSHRLGAEPKRRQWRMKRGGSVVSNKSCERQRSRTPIANLTERAKRSETVGSSPTVTTTREA